MAALSPSQTKNFIRDCLRIREIPYIAGPAGVGKSDVVAQVAEEFDLKLLDIRLSQMLTEDLTGIPSLDPVSKKAKYNPFDTFPMEGDALPMNPAMNQPHRGWLIFLDELSSASEEILAAVYSLLLGHSVGGHKVHSKALIVGAGNRSTDSAIARDLPDTIVSRVLPVEMRADITDWTEWAKEKNVHSELVSFLNKYPDMLHSQVDPNKRGELETFPTPRGWGKAAKVLKLHEKMVKQNTLTRKDKAGIPVEEAASMPLSDGHILMIASSVGEIQAKAFTEHFNEAVTLPYPWDIAQSPGSSRIPGSQIGRVQVINSLTDYFLKSQEQTREGVLQYINRMDGEDRELFADSLAELLGSTPTDKALISKIKKRLKVEDLGPSKPADPDDAF